MAERDENRPAFVAETRLRVRFAETDAMGFTHHSSYIVWLEQARSEYCRIVGLPYTVISSHGINLLVTELSIKYVSPSYFDDEIVILIWCSKFGRASCRFNYQIFDETIGKLCLVAESGHASTNKEGKIVRFFPTLYQLLEAKCGFGPGLTKIGNK